MAGLDDLLTPQDNKIPGADFTFQDADTVKLDTPVDGVEGVRLRGVLAPETASLWKGDTGEAGGTMTTQQVIDLANKMGYTNLVYDRNERDDTGNRFVGDLQDKHGRSFARALASEGILNVSDEHDTLGLRESAEYGAFLRTAADHEESEWDRARNMIAESVQNEQKYAGGFKQQQLISGDARYSDVYNQYAAAFQYDDRELATGKSTNPFSDAWDTGLIGVQESAYGVINMLGETTGYDALANIGEAGVNRAQAKIADRGHFITDYKDVDGFWSAMEYVSNNMAMSLPYMAITIGGTALAPVTGGLSLTAPAAVYSGQTWNEMEGDNKDASIAIGAGVAMATLDRLGLGFIIKSNKAPKALLQDGIDALVKQGMTKEAAEETVMAASRKELAGFAGDAAEVAAQQIKAKRIFQDIAAKGLISSGGEGVTEALQETIGYTAAHTGNNFETFDWNDLTERAIQGAVAGGAIGGAFGGAGALYNTGAWADVAVRQAPAEARRQSQAGMFAEQEINQYGRVASIPELVAQTQAQVAQAGPNAVASIDERITRDKQRRRGRTTGEALAETALSAPALWRGATRFIFNPELQAKSRSARILADMFGANLQKTFSGAHFENEKHHRVGVYKNMVPIPQKVYNHLSGGKRLGKAGKAEISAQVYQQLQAAIDPDTKQFNPDLVQDPIVRQLGIDLNALSDKMWQDQKKFNPDLGYQQNYLMRYKALSKQAVAKQRVKFEQALVSRFGFTPADAKALTDEILDNPEIGNIDEAFSVVKGGIRPGSHQKRSLDLSEQEEFQDFMEQDIFANVAQAAKSAARYTAHRDFIGENGQVIAQLLHNMQQEGVDQETVDKVAKQMQDYLDAESGNYKRPTSDAGKNAMRLQKNFMMITTLAGLPLATVSSFVEAALSMRALTLDQIMGKRGSLATQGKEFANTMWSGMTEVANVALRKEGDQTDASYGRERLRELGFYEWDVGAATVTGVTETNPLQQSIYEGFFKWTGLTGWTNYTRAVRATIAGDYIADKLDLIAQHRDSGEPKTNEIQEAEEALRNLGLNVEDMLNNPTDEVMATNMREATFNWINDAVALPQSANRPLIYQDPRFALFTQFQGFIATFTANHIPKLWDEYVKRGTPAMKYNAFALMATMVMLGFASQHLKDLIKYGLTDKEPKTGANPYLNNAEYIQRGIRASGLLGTGERVLDQFFPLYEQRSDGPGDWIWNTTTGESPALGNIKRIGGAIGKGIQGDVGEAARRIAKATPGIGPFNIVSDLAEDTFDNWNFKG